MSLSLPPPSGFPPRRKSIPLPWPAWHGSCRGCNLRAIGPGMVRANAGGVPAMRACKRRAGMGLATPVARIEPQSHARPAGAWHGYCRAQPLQGGSWHGSCCAGDPRPCQRSLTLYPRVDSRAERAALARILGTGEALRANGGAKRRAQARREVRGLSRWKVVRGAHGGSHVPLRGRLGG